MTPHACTPGGCDHSCDLLIVGVGPAGLAAAVNGASEAPAPEPCGQRVEAGRIVSTSR